MDRRIRRSHNVAMPLVWGVLAHEWWGVSRKLAWDSWQALASCRWSDVVELRQGILLWPSITSGKDAAVSHGLTPQSVLRIVELLVQDRRLSTTEAAQLEEAVLRCVSATGEWR